ncbi:hypothetical protein DNTS_030230 [Danionella cerebrum]|uniref:Relaxin-3 n=1 Tax=Danionella cerebrum TaxID=2873325 RepID=A0A553Q8D5_9TELE|nr:hypothetical protein DNTS_030230 [Danionella translucida]
MCRAVILPLFLLVALLDGVRGSEEHPFYGVKLCGREFIRAVIFTCGGSRWRRASDLLSGDLSTDLHSSRDDAASDNSASSPFVPESETPVRSELIPVGPVFRSPTFWSISEEVLEGLRSSDRKGRDMDVGLSSACCKWGCSKSEIRSLC